MRIFYITFISFIFIGCSSTQKASYTEADTEALKNLVEAKSFEIESTWAVPQTTNSINSIGASGLLPPGSTANRINLIGNANHLRMEGDSVSAYLPYFGERQFSGGYATNNAIVFEGVPENYKVSKNKKNQNYKISFQINDKTESYKVTVLIYPSLNSSIRVTSSQRFPITYTGNAKEKTKTKP